MTAGSLTFAAPGLLWPTALFLGVALLVLIWSYVRFPSHPLRWLCLTLKFVALVALGLCLLDPLWSGQRAKPGANSFAVIADNSEGLQIRDAGETKTRGDWLRAQLASSDPTGWQASLAQNFDLRRYLFDDRLRAAANFEELTFDGRSTALGHSLKTLASRFQGRPLAGVLLFTDGNATDFSGTSVDLKGLPPIYPVVVGKRDFVRDLALQPVRVTQTVFEDAPVSLQADVTVAGYRGKTIQARLLDRNGQEVQAQSLEGGQDGDVVAFRFQVKPTTPGLSFYQVEVAEKAALPTEPAEATLVNNRRVVAIDRKAGPYRVLYVGGRPNWEYKFLNRSLSEDRELDLVGLIRVAKREPKFDFRGRAGESNNPLFRGFGNTGADEAARYDQPVLIRLNTRDELELRNGFPSTAEELYRYHAVIIDDVEAEFFKPEQASLLQTFVSERGGGVLMLGGMESFKEGGFAQTPIGTMLPVYLNSSEEVEGAQAETGGLRLQLSREGWLQPWARLRENEADERSRLDALPSFKVLNHAGPLKPGASLIATARDEAGGEHPALAVQRYGRGRTGALMIGDVWRWGMRDPEARADMEKAWRQWVRWLVSDVPGRVEIAVEPQSEEASGSVGLQVRVRDERYKPLDDAVVSIVVEPVAVKDPANAAPGSVRLQAEPSLKEPGLYEASYVPRFTGGYKASAVVTNAEGAEIGRAETGWSTDLAAEEFRSLTPNVALLEEIARTTGGRMITVDQLAAFARELPSQRAPVMETWTFSLWHTPVMFMIALGCLLAEWGLRRWKGVP